MGIIKRRIIEDNEPTLTLSTCHKAKGREWQRVAILEPELMPSKWARQDWQYQQEQNLIYVAYTRTQSELFIMKPQPKAEAEKEAA